MFLSCERLNFEMEFLDRFFEESGPNSFFGIPSALPLFLASFFGFLFILVNESLKFEILFFGMPISSDVSNHSNQHKNS